MTRAPPQPKVNCMPWAPQDLLIVPSPGGEGEGVLSFSCNLAKKPTWSSILWEERN